MLQPLVIHCKAFDDVLLNAFGNPLPEDDAISGTDSEPDGDNHIEVIVVGCLLLKFGISEFLSTGLWKQFFIIKNVSNMFVNGRRGLTIQQSHLLLSKPHVYIL